MRITRPADSLRRSLGGFQAFTLSIAIMGPTMAMAFVVGLTAQAAGRAVPLAFLLGGLGIALVAFSFLAFARQIASAGSVAAYIDAVFGPRWGFLAGWTLLLVYLSFATSTSALFGHFLINALAHADVPTSGLALGSALCAGLLSIALGGREIRRLTFLMLAIEGCAVLAIVALTIVILARTPWSAAPFQSDPVKGLPGIGFGMAAAVLAFAGFEGATTLGEETHHPQSAIPWAILGAIGVTSLLYVVVSYAQVLGFGPNNAAELARSEVPLDTLSARYISSGFGVLLDLMGGVSALGCVLASTSAAGRLLYAMGRAGFGGRLHLDAIDAQHGTPRRAVVLVGAINILGLLLVASWSGARGYADATAMIGTLAIILVYVGVCVAQSVAAARASRWALTLVGFFGAAMLCWPLFNSLYPVPPWPAKLWPMVLVLWTISGIVLALLRERGGRSYPSEAEVPE